jgi:hypothetical protein
LPGSLARQPCPVALPASLARPGSLARQPYRKVCKIFYGRRPACMQYCQQFSSSFPCNKRHCDFKPCVQIDIDL